MGLIHPLDQTVFDLPTETPGDPGAGNQFTVNLPANCRAELTLVTFHWVSSAVAANRYIRIQVDLAGLAIWYATYIPAALINEIHDFAFVAGGPPSPLVAPGGQYKQIGFGRGLANDAVQTLRIAVTNMQGGDNITDIFYQYKRWPFPNYVY